MDRPSKYMRFPGVVAPPARLSREEEEKLSVRQRKLLDELEELIVSEPVSGYTMAQIADCLNCSLRTLYAIAASKEGLLLIVADRRLRRIGGAALRKLEPDMSPLVALRTYLQATNEAVQPESLLLQKNLSGVAGFLQNGMAHQNFLTAIVQHLLDRAVSEGQIEKIDTHAMAIILGSLGGYLGRPENAPLLQLSPKETADAITDIIIRGMTVEKGKAR